MTWRIIVNDSRKQSDKIEDVQKKTKETCYLSLYKNQSGGRKPSIAFIGQLHLYDHHFFISFTLDLFLLTAK